MAEYITGGIKITDPSVFLGKSLGKYEVRDIIGRGSMGVIFKVWDTIEEEFKTIKMVPPEIVFDHLSFENLKREVKAATKISHPNVVKVMSLEEVEGLYFIVMEYIEGQTLGQRLVAENCRKLHQDEVLEYARQIAIGLGEAHRQGVIHMDLKPQNIMVKKTGEVKILDFSISYQMTHSLTLLTGRQLSTGTLPYMAPEQLSKNYGRINEQTDIWGLGAVLYHLLSGEVPFERENQVVNPNENPFPLTDVSPGLVAIVARCLCKDREKRYRNTGELLADIDRLKEKPKTGQLPGNSKQPCPQCGKEIEAAWLGCPFCGCSLKKKEVPPAAKGKPGKEPKEKPEAKETKRKKRTSLEFEEIKALSDEVLKPYVQAEEKRQLPGFFRRTKLPMLFAGIVLVGGGGWLVSRLILKTDSGRTSIISGQPKDNREAYSPRETNPLSPQAKPAAEDPLAKLIPALRQQIARGEYDAADKSIAAAQKLQADPRLDALALEVREARTAALKIPVKADMLTKEDAKKEELARLEKEYQSAVVAAKKNSTEKKYDEALRNIAAARKIRNSKELDELERQVQTDMAAAVTESEFQKHYLNALQNHERKQYDEALNNIAIARKIRSGPELDDLERQVNAGKAAAAAENDYQKYYLSALKNHENNQYDEAQKNIEAARKIKNSKDLVDLENRVQRDREAMILEKEKADKARAAEQQKKNAELNQATSEPLKADETAKQGAVKGGNLKPVTADLHEVTLYLYNEKLRRIEANGLPAEIQAKGQFSLTLSVDKKGGIAVQTYSDGGLEVTPTNKREAVKNLIIEAMQSLKLNPPKDKNKAPIKLENWRLTYKFGTFQGKVILTRQP